MAMDMGAMMKMMAAKNQFEKNHPKFFSFCKAAFGKGVEVDTIFEITVTKPNGETLTTNLKVCQSDLDLFEGLKDLGRKQEIYMKRMPNMNDNIDKYAVMKEEKGSVVLIGIAVVMVIVMLIMSI